MNISNKYKLQINFRELEVVETLDFRDYPILTLEKDKVGSLYLSYLIGYEKYEQRAVIEISQKRIESIKSGELSVKYSFENAENKIIYLINYSIETGEVQETWIVPIYEFIPLNIIPDNYQYQHEEVFS